MKFERYQIENNEVVIPLPESLGDCLTLIKSDRFRFHGKEFSSLSIILDLVHHPCKSVLAWFRLAKYNGPLGAFFRFMYRRTSARRCIALSSTTKVGYGFYIGHNCCLVVNENTIIGNNVNIAQFVNIGSNENKHAIIGDNVYIGPNTSIVEDVEIGSNATIGAGAVVCKDIPANCTAVGAPAKAINYNNPGRYVINRWTPRK